MALIIEDGTGVSGADSYVTVAECEAFSDKFFGTPITGTTAEIEAALRRAALFMDSFTWKGHKTHGREQGLAWPRKDVEDGEGQEIPEGEIPQEVKDAQCIFARAEAETPGLLTPVVNIADKKVLVEVKGIRWQPRAAPNTVEASRPVVTMAIDKVQGLLKAAEPKFLLRA